MQDFDEYLRRNSFKISFHLQNRYSTPKLAVPYPKHRSEEVDDETLAVKSRHDLSSACGEVRIPVGKKEFAAKRGRDVSGNVLGPKVINVFAGEWPFRA